MTDAILEMAKRAHQAKIALQDQAGSTDEKFNKWQAKREMKRKMYEMTDEQAPIIRERKKEQLQQCQRCLQIGHWTYECKNAPVYAKRVSRTKQLLKLDHKPAAEPVLPPWIEEQRQEAVRKEEELKKREEKLKKQQAKFERQQQKRAEKEALLKQGGAGAPGAAQASADEPAAKRRRAEEGEEDGKKKKTKKGKKKAQKKDKQDSSSGSDSSDSDSSSSSDSSSDSDSSSSGSSDSSSMLSLSDGE